MRQRGVTLSVVAAVLLAATALVAAAGRGDGQALPGCAAGQTPAFTGMFAALQQRLGGLMGEPASCPYTRPRDVLVYQDTTTGLAYQYPLGLTVFTDGHRHWGLTPDGPIYWEGPSMAVPEAPCTWEAGTGRPTVGEWYGPRQAFWTVVVGSFRTREPAEALGVEMCLANISAGVVNSNDYRGLTPGYWVTHSGWFRSQPEAAAEARRLQTIGFTGAYPRHFVPWLAGDSDDGGSDAQLGWALATGSPRR